MKKDDIKHIVKFTNIDFVIDIINNKYIYLSSPLKFNDPLDSYFVRLIGSKPYFTEDVFLKGYMEINKEIFVFCGTNEPNIENVLMWSHYGENHKGIALKYKVPENLSGELNFVDYESHTHEELVDALGYNSQYNVPPQKDEEEKYELIKSSIFLKNEEWNYENEIRYMKRFKNDEETIEKGWEVDSVYIGSEYLKNDNEHLKEILKIVDLCREKKIKIFRLEYSYAEKDKKFRLQKQEWMQQEHMDEIENYGVVRREIISKLKNRLKDSIEGEVLREFIKEVSTETVNEIIQDQLRDAELLLGNSGI